MILCISDLLNKDEIRQLLMILADRRSSDAPETGRSGAEQVWFGTDIPPNHREQLCGLLLDRLMRHSVFALASRPRIFGPLHFLYNDSELEPSVAFDGGTVTTIRRDVSFVLSLSNPEDYEDGQFALKTDEGEQSYRQPAGSVVLFPSDHSHHLYPVSAGHRILAFGSLQSYVADPIMRELLFDLDTARHALFKKQGATEEFALLSECTKSLLHRSIAS